MPVKQQNPLLKGWVTEITIDAPQQKVWDRLVDFGSYPHWNPFMLEAHATLEVGSTIRFLETLQEFGEHWITAKFQVIQSPEVLVWQGHIYAPFLFNVRHSFRLEFISETQTHLVHSHRHTGWLLPMLAHCGVFDRSYQGYLRFNEALKHQCETSDCHSSS
jgi:hypothetical protein